jgi:hypothetical protein
MRSFGALDGLASRKRLGRRGENEVQSPQNLLKRFPVCVFVSAFAGTNTQTLVTAEMYTCQTDRVKQIYPPPAETADRPERFPNWRRWMPMQASEKIELPNASAQPEEPAKRPARRGRNWPPEAPRENV